MTQNRAFLIVMDSVGIGGAPDAAQFFNGTLPDSGANTLGHIAQARALHMPHLDALGLGAALQLASGARAPGLGATPQGIWGAATEVSPGKDTPSGHWEIAGVPVPWDWHYFPDTRPSFPPDLSARIAQAAGTEGILGNEHASGTEIIARLGAQHLRTGWPICYSSADSVLQIAAHEDSFGLQRLYRLCQDVAAMVHPMRVGRVIARPFTGAEGGFSRTGNRRDFAIAPPGQTILDAAQAAGRQTYAVGKIGDIFSHRGIAQLHKGSDAVLADHLIRLADQAAPGSLTFANFVEFDSLYGHRRDVEGYAAALEWFDAVAGQVLARLRPGDLAIFTADHGNDPTWPGTDHTRERVPVLGWGYGARAIGQVGFADIAASVAAHLGLPPVGPGKAFL
ncbi:phosphopentomutase [Paracoccus shanxieyensis]|uniref:Phosphopentomutase n=1 Tax=Paracoccus shanxieyensis TaxID=2675752 RepID=A0A6L6IXN4_9RHOB|nr:phosphopentomutase [Paracoccus shanxieyensis]MTH64368.1 phosphopentomutase [Paracoccus shanxieyensis]MTH87639.1 phosphopentomutase [Paracoccus shanxieyensis]